MTSHVDGRVVVITGAASGFGRLLAGKLAALGARIVASDIDEAGLEATRESIVSEAGTVEAFRADVTNRIQMSALATHAVERFGAIDVMVNNAGVMPLAFYADHAKAADAWDRCIDINLKGVLNGIVAVHDQMIGQGRGHIVNLSSIAGNHPVGGAAVYGATKAAVNVLSEALRQESGGQIKVTTIRPTGVPGTNLGEAVLNPDAIRGMLGANSDAFFETMGRLAENRASPELLDPEDIAYFALAPELLTDQIVFAIDQPWGVSISDLTVRASGDGYVI